jgi:PDZ domain-containing protein
MIEEISSADSGRQRKVPRYKIVLAVFTILFIISIVFLTNYRVDKVIMEPGDSVPTEESITVTGAPQFESDGSINFLTVLISANKPALIEYLWARYMNQDVEIFDWKEVNGELSPEESTEINEALMLASQGAASSVALETIGCDVPRSGSGAIITNIGEDTPANDIGLKRGDTIVGINGQEIQLDEDAFDILGKTKPGTEVTLRIELRDRGDVVTKKVTLVEHPDRPGNGFLGVVLATRDLRFDYPVNIEYDPGGVSGPSAGLAFTLHIIDLLTEGDLTGGNNIAITGEIALDGSVNPVGGIKQKAVAARESGADIMMVPTGESDEAKKASGDMKVHEVSTIEDAINVLVENGGDPLPQVQSCPTS